MLSPQPVHPDASVARSLVPSLGVDDVAVPAGAGLVPAVGGGDQQVHQPVGGLQLLAHLGHALAVAAAAVVDALA